MGFFDFVGANAARVAPTFHGGMLAELCMRTLAVPGDKVAVISYNAEWIPSNFWEDTHE
jgi:hypothetical protein